MADTASPITAQSAVIPSFESENPDRDLLLRFESLGGQGHGCEFGLVQRHFGAEPLGLLRWADLPHDLLCQALETRLDGIGAPENTIVFQPEGEDDWWTKDRRYWMAMRTFNKVADITLDEITIQVGRRLRFLTRKLIEDLQTGVKIFVFKDMFRNLAEPELARLHAAVRSYGDAATLFYVRYADETHPVGSVEVAAPGLIIGYIEHFAFSPEEKHIGLPHSGWLALCRGAWLVLNGEPEPAPIRTGPRHQRAGKRRRIVLMGNCQADSMGNLYRRFVAARTGDIVDYVATYQDLTPSARDIVEQADLIVEQIFDLSQHAETGGLAVTTPRLHLPMVTAGFLWPFAGHAHPKNVEYPWMPSGPYGGEAGDSYLNRLIAAGTPPETAVEIYADLDITSRVDLDRMYELLMDRQRARDQASNYQIADIVENHFRTEQVFLSPYHPNLRVALALASQLFRQVGAEQQDIDRMYNCVRETPFPKSELPLHPGVCRHFGLTFVASDRRYRYLNEGLFTFREYAMRYLNYEWNAALEEGTSLTHAGQLDKARVLLENGLTRSPASAAGHNSLSYILGEQGDNDGAAREAQYAVEIEPRVGVYHASLGSALWRMNQLEKAEGELLFATLLDPTDTHHFVLLAHLCRQRGEIATGRDYIRKALGYEPFLVRLQTEDASFSEAMEDYPGAISALRRAISLLPDDPSLSRDLDRLLSKYNQTGDTSTDDPSAPVERAQNFRRIADRLVDANDLDGAVAALRQATRLDPREYVYHCFLSDILGRLGRLPESLAEAQAGYDVAPGNAHALGHLAHIMNLTGDHRQAVSMYRRAIAMAPNDEHLRQQLSCIIRHRGPEDSVDELPTPDLQTKPEPSERAMRTRIDHVMEFGLTGNAQGHRKYGWLSAEQNGCWSFGVESAICLPRPNAPFGFFLELHVYPNLYFPLRMFQILTITCNERPIATLTIDRSGIFAVFVSPPQAAEPQLVIRFGHPSSFRPKDVLDSLDERQLAIKFDRIRVMPLLSPWQSTLRSTSAQKITGIRNEDIIDQAQRITGAPMQEVLGRFEVIAGNCDMGVALREVGHEWLSLLRFAGATPEVAIRGLENDFEGVGESITAEIADNPIREWMIRDSIDLRFHTGQSSLDLTEANIRGRFPRYINRIKEKLLEDLDESSKIFVCGDQRGMNSLLSLEYIMPLYLAIRRRSSSALLWVCPSRNREDTKGSVTKILPGLALAELDVVKPPVLIGGGVTVSGWVEVLCNAWNVLK